MRIGLVSCFDLGRSFGLTDATFKVDYQNDDPDISLVGIRNPLGNGTTFDVLSQAPGLIKLWRQEAIYQVQRAEIETGWNADLGVSRAKFDAHLASVIASHEIERCQLTIFALGTVFLNIQLGSGIEVDSALGVLSCWEFAGYRPDISNGLLECAQEQAHKSVSTVVRSDFAGLTSRSAPNIERSTSGYEESTLFKSFTNTIQCTDFGDTAELPRWLSIFELSVKPIDFEYHGKLHYSWASCLLVPRGEEEWTPSQELERIWECISIAHVFLGTCEAFRTLFEDEMHSQVESYFGIQGRRRGPSDLNRLRTLALAVVSLTDFARITQSEEDQEYFRKFARSANLERTQQLISDSVQVLYEVQEAEAQEERTRRESMLNGIVVVLATLTVVSVTADAYNFVREQETLFPFRGQRLGILTSLLFVLIVMVTLLLWRILHSRRGQPTPRRPRRKK